MKTTVKYSIIIASLILLMSPIGAPAAPPPPKPQDVVVDNTTSNPVPVKDVENPARQPFSTSANAFFEPGSRDAIFNLPTAPAGKTLVIEFVTVNALIPTGQNLWSANINHVPLVIVPQGDVGTGNDAFTASQQCRFYISDQGEINFIVSRNSTTGSGVVGATVSGYLVSPQ
jgi:hypothetical protein